MGFFGTGAAFHGRSSREEAVHQGKATSLGGQQTPQPQQSIGQQAPQQPTGQQAADGIASQVAPMPRTQRAPTQGMASWGGRSAGSLFGARGPAPQQPAAQPAAQPPAQPTQPTPPSPPQGLAQQGMQGGQGGYGAQGQWGQGMGSPVQGASYQAAQTSIPDQITGQLMGRLGDNYNQDQMGQIQGAYGGQQASPGQMNPAQAGVQLPSSGGGLGPSPTNMPGSGNAMKRYLESRQAGY